MFLFSNFYGPVRNVGKFVFLKWILFINEKWYDVKDDVIFGQVQNRRFSNPLIHT